MPTINALILNNKIILSVTDLGSLLLDWLKSSEFD
jgi:hypothetical protein